MKKTISKASKKKSVKTEKFEYNVLVKFNDQVFKFKTNDLKESIMALKPVFLKTKIYFKIKKGRKVCERQFFVFKGKQLFTNRLSMDIFINKLIFK